MITWKTLDGREISIEEMEDDHLGNTIRFLIRTGGHKGGLNRNTYVEMVREAKSRISDNPALVEAIHIADRSSFVGAWEPTGPAEPSPWKRREPREKKPKPPTPTGRFASLDVEPCPTCGAKTACECKI